MATPAGFENKVAFIWKIADKLRGHLKPHEYGTVMLPPPLRTLTGPIRMDFGTRGTRRMRGFLRKNLLALQGDAHDPAPPAEHHPHVGDGHAGCFRYGGHARPLEQ